MSSPRSNRFPSLSLALVVAGALALAAAAFAADKAEPTASGPASTPPPAAAMPAIPENAEELKATQGTVPAPATVTRRPLRKLSPMMAEILAYLETRDQAMALKKQQAGATAAGPADALAAATELQRMKQETELEVLAIQARWARKEGRTADAERIEATIEEILHPKVPSNPETRPAPSTPSR